MLKRFFPSSALSMRLMSLAGLVLFVAGAFVLLGGYLYGRSAADRAYDQLLRGAVLQITEGIYVEEGRPVVDIPPSSFTLLGYSEGDHVFYAVLGPDGGTIAGYDGLKSEFEPAWFLFSSEEYRGFDLRKISYGHVLVEEGFSGQIGVIIAQTKEARTALANEIILRVLLVLSVLGVVIFVLLSLAIVWATRPINALEAELRARDPLDFSPLRTEMPREMRTFSDNMNRFLLRLKRRVDSMQMIIADSTHQIRTPIAAIQAQADLPINYNDPDAMRENKQRIQKQARDLSRLSEQLLTQALVTHRADTVEMANIDLRKAVLEAEKSLRYAKLWSDDDWRTDLSVEPCIVRGDLFSLREAVKNLITNALEYGEAPVFIRVIPERISVCDHGTGFEPDECPSGHGRGLAIVRGVMETHGGRFFYESSAERFCAVLDFGAPP